MNEIFQKNYKKSTYNILETNLTFYIADLSRVLVSAQLQIVRVVEKEDLVLDGKNLDLKSIKVNGSFIPARYLVKTSENLTIRYSFLRQFPDKFELATLVSLDPTKNHSLEGLYISSGILCSQCEPEGFRKITYFIDRPDIMSKFNVKIMSEIEDFTLLAGGNLVSSKQEDSVNIVRYSDPYARSSYLFALVAGNLEKNSTNHQGAKISIYADDSGIKKTDLALDIIKKAFDFDEQVYGCRYDLNEFNVVAIDDFNAGAMENKGLNIFNSSCILADKRKTTDREYVNILAVIAHEYFHNWSGNRVSVQDWFQLTLKEGLTTFREQEFVEKYYSAVSRIDSVESLIVRQFAEDSSELAHAPRPASYKEISNFYTGTVYEKGAEIVRMLHTILGSEKFHERVRAFFSKYDGMAVRVEEFLDTLNIDSSFDTAKFMNWYNLSGTPVVDCQMRVEEGVCKVKFTQHSKNASEMLSIPIKISLYSKSSSKLLLSHLCLLEDMEKEYSFPVAEKEIILSALENFSAPVILNYENTFEELDYLIVNCSDLFNRYFAYKKLVDIYFESAFSDVAKATKALEGILGNIDSVIKLMLSDDKQELAYLVKFVSVGSLEEIFYALSKKISNLDIDKVKILRENLLKAISDSFETEFLAVYNAYKDNTEEDDGLDFSIKDIGRRQAKNIALFFLVVGSNRDKYKQLVETQFNSASNMTDEMTAFRLLVNYFPDMGRENIFNNFVRRYSGDTEIYNNALAVIASAMEITLEEIKMFMMTGHFSIKNPDNVYSLLACFARNLFVFHNTDKEHYIFFAKSIIEIEKFNPQMASRMFRIFADYRLFDTNRQQKMIDVIKYIDKNCVSKNIKEFSEILLARE